MRMLQSTLSSFISADNIIKITADHTIATTITTTAPTSSMLIFQQSYILRLVQQTRPTICKNTSQTESITEQNSSQAECYSVGNRQRQS